LVFTSFSLSSRNMKKLIYLITFLLLLNVSPARERYVIKCNDTLLIASRVVLISQIGIKELTNRNDGIQVNKYQASCGLLQGKNGRKGAAYCNAFQVWCFITGAYYLDMPDSYIPIPKQGLANGTFNYAKRTGKKTSYAPRIDDLLVWNKTNTPNGHIERIIKILPAGWVYTVGGNTGDTGGNDGVNKKKRNLYHPLSAMVVRGLVGFNI